MSCKFLLVVFTSIFLSTTGIAQSWAPQGAIWHYSEHDWLNPHIESYITIESIKDTVVDGQPCKLLLETDRMSGITTTKRFMYSDSNQVFLYVEDSSRWFLLYDFGLGAGDTFDIGFEFEPLQVVIDSVDYIDINGQNRKVQYCHSNHIAIDFGGIFVEGIGRTSYLFPTYENDLRGPLRCYEDDTLGQHRSPFYDPWMEACDQVITHVKPSLSPSPLKVYPNPSSAFMHISLPEVTKEMTVEVINARGQVIKQMQLTQTHLSVECTSWPAGLYHIILRDSVSHQIVARQNVIKT